VRVLVTRPQPQADQWVARLRAAGFDAQALPLIAIEALSDAGPLREAWRVLAHDALVVFVSPNAVTQFFAARDAAQAWPAGVLAAGTGPGTAAALRAQGVPEALIVQPLASATQFDSEALWNAGLASREWAGRSVFIVRGDGGRDWLADTLAARGARVRFVHAYARAVPRLDAAQRGLLADALARPREHVWLFSSSQAIAHLAQLAPPHGDWSTARALATHPRIAQSARALGIVEVRDAPPDEAQVIAALSAMRS